MTQQPQQLAFEETHRNHFLFSDYYLDNRVRDRPEWGQNDAGTRAAFDAIAEQWEAYTPTPNEQATEREWIRPVLDVLGHHYEVQVSMKVARGYRTPDYFFYPDEASRQAAKDLTPPLSEEELRGALAVGDAKAWERSLSMPAGSGTRQARTSDNPTVQIDEYVRYSGLPWGILTNGRRWRLYHADSSKEFDVYYEVDLPALIEQGDTEAFKYFYLFFRRRAFTATPAGSAFLEQVLEQSRIYEQGVGDSLKDQVYEALRYLAQGFLDFPDNDLDPTPETLNAVYDNSLIVLYRLLFILYAEARGLLPVHENDVYTDRYSLYAIKRRIADELKYQRKVVPSMSHYWDQLAGLWHVLEGGNPDLEVPAYDGGLFDPDEHEFLEQHAVGDLHLRTAVDLLARTEDPQTGTREFVDYRDLDVRHLGSIYEGLLEYHLQIDDEIESSDRDREERQEDVDAVNAVPPAPNSQIPTPVVLVNSKGERKATGSYYTPDYIVQYIVEQTVGPVLQEVLSRHTDEQEAIIDEAALVEEVLAVNVLDPAMGSGHFLVGATNYIARFLVELGLSSVERPGETDELAYWRRRVVQACVYGVDLNPLAVELAKLSLWLATVARGKPLNFLDHHLRPGNSLIGARVGELPLRGERTRSSYQERKEREARDAGQLSMLDDSAFAGSMRTATGMMAQIEALEGETLAEVHEAKRIYTETVRDVTRDWRILADVWTARHFGLELDEEVWGALAQHVLRAGFEVPQYDEIIAEARTIAGERRFFHWELEFPEVFFDEHGRLLDGDAGFDAVVGNPPYVRMEGFKNLKDYLRQTYEVHETRTDLYAYFMERSLQLIRLNGTFSFIVSNKWLRSNYGEQVRRLVLERAKIRQLVDFGDLPVFDVTTYPLIFVFENDQYAEDNDVFYATVPDLQFSDLRKIVQEVGHEIQQASLTTDEWKLLDSRSMALLARLTEESEALLGYVGGPSQMGIKTGLNEAFVINRETRDSLIGQDAHSSDIIYPLCVGSEIRRYALDWEEQFLIYTPHGIDISKYPAVLEHLKPYQSKLEGRATEQEWYELQQPQEAYKEQFLRSKIIQPDIAERGRFYLDRTGMFMTNTAYFLPIDDPFLLALLNSKLLQFCLASTSATYRGGYLRLFGQYVEKLPIPNIQFTTTQDERGRLAEKSRRLYERCMEKDDPDCVLGFVAHQLTQEPERSDVVHDTLAFLAERMIAMHAEQQQVVEDFWLDLEGVVADADTFETLRTRGKWEQSLWKYVEACRPFVDEDSRSTRHLDESLGWTEACFRGFVGQLAGSVDNLSDLVRVYRRQAPRYQDLADRIAGTDALIDRIVYRLYGLTEEEIAIVDGSGER